MTSLTQKKPDAGFLLSRASGNRSMDNAVLIEGQNLEAGTVLGRISASGKVTAVDEDAMTGEEVAVAILLNGTDATLADTPVAIVARDAEVIADQLVWPVKSPPFDTDNATEELADVGIICRGSGA